LQAAKEKCQLQVKNYKNDPVNCMSNGFELIFLVGDVKELLLFGVLLRKRFGLFFEFWSMI